MKNPSIASPYTSAFHKLFDERTFGAALCDDMEKAQSLVLIKSPFITDFGVERLENIIARCTSRRVRVCMMLKPPQYWEQRGQIELSNAIIRKLDEFDSAVASLRRVGAHVSMRYAFHEKIVLVDEAIAWEGSANSMSFCKNGECVNRWMSFDHRMRLLCKFGLNTCDVCALNGQFPFFQGADVDQIVRLLGRTLLERRMQLGLSQGELALRARVPQPTVSRIEKGERGMRVETLLKLHRALDLAIVSVPSYKVPALVEQSPTKAVGAYDQIVLLEGDRN